MTAPAEDGADLLVTLAKAGIACPPTGVPLLEIPRTDSPGRCHRHSGDHNLALGDEGTVAA